jgi:hypothetical protein
MTSNKLYTIIKNSDTIDYNYLVQQFPVEQVNFALYDLKKYIHNDTIDKEKRYGHFRDQLQKRYPVCIITNSPFEMCDACHIIPHSQCNYPDKTNIDNGLILRTDLHRLFDNHLLKINPFTSTVELSDSLLTNDSYKDYHKFHHFKVTIHPDSIPFLKRIY